MKTGGPGPAREFTLRFTERIYRLHEAGINNHAPRGAGVFEIVLFPPGAEDGEVLYVGSCGSGESVAAQLRAIREGSGGMDAPSLRVVQENLANAYFDAVSDSDANSDDDRIDLAWALVQAKHPRLNSPERQAHSGRFSEISYREQA